jgi:hypothetical protein
MKLLVGAFLASAVMLLLGACEAPVPAGGANAPVSVPDTGNGGGGGGGGY